MNFSRIEKLDAEAIDIFTELLYELVEEIETRCFVKLYTHAKKHREQLQNQSPPKDRYPPCDPNDEIPF